VGSASQLIWIALWMSGGIALRALGLRARAIDRLNRFIIWFPLPATILLELHRLSWRGSYWVPISMAWIVFVVGTAFFCVLGKIRKWPKHTIGALVLTVALGNTSFLGYPLIRAIYGERAIQFAVLNDQPGSFLVLATLGIIAASYFSSRQSSVRAVLGRVLRFPPIWATALAFALHPVRFPGPFETLLGIGLNLLIPLALISIGAQLNFSKKQFERELSPLAFGLLYKLAIAPLIIALIFVVGLGLRGEMIRVTLLEAAMGPMITGTIVAREYELDPSLCSLIVTIGIPLCLITVPLFARILALFGT